MLPATKKLLTAAAFLLIGTIASSAAADQITATFVGDIETFGDTRGLWSGIEVGDRFAAWITFDSQLPDERPDDPDTGVYLCPTSAEGTMVVESEGYYTTLEADSFTIHIQNDGPNGDEFLAFAFIDYPQIDWFYPPPTLTVMCTGGTDVFSDDSLPTELSTADFADCYFEAFYSSIDIPGSGRMGGASYSISTTDTDVDGFNDNVDNCSLVANPDQIDVDLDGFGNFCDADFNNDGWINFADLAYMKSVFFSSDPLADLNSDGLVNFMDLGLMKSVFFGEPGPGADL